MGWVVAAIVADALFRSVTAIGVCTMRVAVARALIEMAQRPTPAPTGGTEAECASPSS
jgi:threonine/homoserine efflux transporter RhtA